MGFEKLFLYRTLTAPRPRFLPICRRWAEGHCIATPSTGDWSHLTWLQILLITLSFVASASANDGDLLAGTLKTFQRHACQGTVLPLQCPFNTTIDIIHANYGGAQPPLCPFLEGTKSLPSNHSGRCSYPSKANTKIVQTVFKLCHRKRSCSIPVPSPSEYWVEDPCPFSNKYVEVAFKCRPDIFINKILCEGERLSLDCGPQSRIAIYSSMFGRTKHGSLLCPQTNGFPEEDCSSKFAIDIIMNECHGYPQCQMMATSDVFGRPCPSEYLMYLKTLYTCVPSWILKPPDNMRNIGTSATESAATTDEPRTTNDEFIDSSSTHRTRVNDGTGLDAVSLRPLTPNEIINCTVAILSDSREKEVGIIREWMRAVAFINKHYEKFLLYLILGVILGVLACLVVLLTRFVIHHRRLKSQTRDTGHFVGEIDDVDGDLDMITPTSSSSEGDGYSPPLPVAPPQSQNTVRFNTGTGGRRSETRAGGQYQDVDLIPPRSLSRENNHYLYN